MSCPQTMTAGYPQYIPGTGAVTPPTGYSFYLLFTGAMGYGQSGISGWGFKSATSQTWYSMATLQTNLIAWGKTLSNATVYVGPNDYFGFLNGKTVTNAATALGSMLQAVNSNTPASVLFYAACDAEMYSWTSNGGYTTAANAYSDTLTFFQQVTVSCIMGGSSAGFDTQSHLRSICSSAFTLYPQLYNPGTTNCSSPVANWSWWPADSASPGYSGMQIDPSPYSTTCCCCLTGWTGLGHSTGSYTLFDWDSQGKGTCDSSGT